MVGLILAVLGLSHRMAFTVTRSGAAALITGVLILGAVALVRNWPGPRSSTEELNLLLSATLVLFAVVGALRPYKYDLAASALTIGAAATFILLEPFTPLRRYRLWVVTPLLLAAHVSLLLHFNLPKQDVYRFLTFGVDGLLHHGINPYLPIHDPVSVDVQPYTFTYPPGALLLVAPFRLMLGDVRWAYVVAEGVFVAAVALMAHRGGELRPWQQAAILLPLVFPRTNQAFYDYGNHEWLLLALAASALVVRRHWFWCGVLLGVGLATKQYFILFPLLFLVPWVERRALVTAAITAGIIVLPFAVWDAGRLFHDTTNQLGAPPDAERLTLYAMTRGAGFDVGRGGAALLAVVGLLFAAGCAWLGRLRLDRALVACGVALAVFTLCADFAAYNYYGYALAFVAWGLALSDVDQRQQPWGPDGVLGIPG